MKHPRVLIAVLGAGLLALAGCGEKPQELGASKHGAAAFQGVGNSPFVSSDWKAGDQKSWEQHLKARAQYGQNDYTRMGK